MDKDEGSSYEYHSDMENQPEFLFMELKSTTSFGRDIDIDAMLEHTTFDDFMKGLYANRILGGQKQKKGEKPKTEFEMMWSQVMGGGADKEQDLALQFDEPEEQS